MDNINSATTNPNPHYITNPNSFYYGEQLKHWASTPIAYSTDIAIENQMSSVLEFPLDRIIYASNEYCFRERTRRNKGELNLPFMNYYRTGYDTSDKLWFNDFQNRFWLLDSDNKFTSQMGGRMKIYPVNIEYEGTVFFAQNKDCEYAINKLMYVASNETIITPELEMNDGTIIKNAGVFNLETELNPNYQENDWLEQNRIWTIGLSFSVRTFMIGEFNQKSDDGSDDYYLNVSRKAVLEFFSAKKLNYQHPMQSEDIVMLLSEYFGE